VVVRARIFDELVPMMSDDCTVTIVLLLMTVDELLDAVC
jgi:hypothetical protein